MYVSFEEISEDSRIWIYLANRAIQNEELELMSDRIQSFLVQWKAHGKALKSSFKILYNQFIIIAVDEDHHSPSGCSIDESVHFLRQIEQETKINLFERGRVPFLFDDALRLVEISDIKSNVENGVLDAETLTFNPTIQHKKELGNRWIQSSGSSWLKRHIIP